MSDDSEQDKSEQPSSHKLKRAREKGSVARGMDLGFLTVLASTIVFAWLAGASLTDELAQTAIQALATASTVLTSPQAVLGTMGGVLTAPLRPLGFLAATIFLTVLLFELIQTGVVFSTTPLKPDFSRLDPAKGLKRVFSIRLLLETAKTVFKIAIYGAIAILIIQQAVRLAPTIPDAARLADAMRHLTLRLMAFVALAAIAFVVIDQLVVRRDFLKKMRMSRREVRREHRDREGDARLKQRRKELHGQFVKVSQSLRNLQGADVLITNPTRLAVALRYDPLTMEAPRVVSKGSHQVALRLRRLAFIHGVIIVEDRVLARELYRRSDIDRQIPDTCFRRVADIYLDVRSRRETTSRTPDV